MSRTVSEIIPIAISGAWRRRYLIAIPIVVMPILGALAAFIAPKAYESRMTILVQEPGKLNPILNDLAIGADLKDRMPSLQALLTSKHVLIDVLKDLGQIGPGSDPKTTDLQVGNLAEALTSNLIGAELIELKIRGPRPEGLAKTLAAVGARFMERVVAPGRGSVDSSETFLHKQLDQERRTNSRRPSRTTPNSSAATRRSFRLSTRRTSRASLPCSRISSRSGSNLRPPTQLSTTCESGCRH